MSYSRRRSPRLFTKDIEQLLYALGDGPYSLDASVNALEDCLVEYLTALCMNLSIYAKSKNRARVKLDDFPFVLRNDPYKLSRLEYIINQSIKIENSRKLFDDNDRKLANYGDSEDDDEEKPDDKKKKKKKRKTDDK